MVKFYYLQVKMGKITIDDVPERYRDKVKAAYKELYGEYPE